MTQRDHDEANEFLDWLANLHRPEDERRWSTLVEQYGYALPAPVWACVQTIQTGK